MPRLQSATSREQGYRAGYDRDIVESGRVGSTLMDNFTSGIQDFDPDAAFNRRLTAAQESFKRQFTRDVEALRGSQVRRGRTNTGFAFQDEDRLFEEMAGRFAEVSGSAALTTAGMDMDRLALIGAHGERASDRAMSARGGEYHTLRGQRLQDQADRRQMWGNIAGGLGSAIGAIWGRG